MRTQPLCFGAAVLAALCVHASASAEPQQYVIKQTIPSLGTSIKRPIVITGSIPLDEKYADLTAEQKNSLKALYEKMGEKDEPPFPLHGLRPLYEALAQAHEHLELAYRGQLTVYVQVDSEGLPHEMFVVETPDQQISQAAANILATQKFKPALCDGAPCSMRYVFHAQLVGPEVHDMKSTNPSSGVQINKTSGY